MHETYMKAALDEAIKGCGWVSPNPMVGAVIVRDGEVIGEGYHRKYGEAHAERNALASCSVDPAGSVMYVTLEPCCHYGKTPPCTEAVLESGIATVVIGAMDPNPVVAGKGADFLERHGVRIIRGVLEEECKQLNEVFFHYITKKTPFVVMKYAMTLDGKIAAASGKSRGITGSVATEHVHRSRHRYTGIMAGIGTVIADDPLLTCRLPGCKNPIRILCDTRLRISPDSKIAKTACEVPTIIATSAGDCAKARLLSEMGIEILRVPDKGGHVDLKKLMTLLGEKKIDSILLEGGAALNAAALESGIVHKVHAYIAPKILGGSGAVTPVGGAGADGPDQALFLKECRITQLGEDILLEYKVNDLTTV